MRISDWSSDVCSSDLFIDALADIDAETVVPVGRGFIGDVGIPGECADLLVETGSDHIDVGARLVGDGRGVIFDIARGIAGGVAELADRARPRRIVRAQPIPRTIAVRVNREILAGIAGGRSEAHKFEPQSLLRLSYAVFL